MKKRIIIKKFAPFPLKNKEKWFKRNLTRKLLFHLRNN